MLTVVFWLLIMALFAVVTHVGRRFRLIPIVSQLLLASIGLPLLMLFWIEPHWQLNGAQLVAPVWLKSLYGLSFALLLGTILSDVIDLQLDRQSLKIALPSFAVPFTCGLACAVWVLPEQPWLSSLAVGLVFAITAIPVLYLYLHHIDYPPAATRRLVQSAIVIDLTCWSLFGLAQGSLDLSSVLLPLAGAMLPLLMRALRIRHPLCYSLSFFALLVVAEHYRLNALIFGVGYLVCMAWLKVPLVMPLKGVWLERVQTTLAIPLILTFGIVQIDVHSALNQISPLQLAALLLLPMASKVLGNWVGLNWATPSFVGASQWRESLLLNIRGLSEIVFLNLLLQQHLISPALYVALMLMSLIATLLPALAGMSKPPLKSAVVPGKERLCQE